MKLHYRQASVWGFVKAILSKRSLGWLSNLLSAKVRPKYSWSGSRHFGRGASEIAIEIRDWRTLRRIALNADLALGEAWMDGTLTVERGGIYGFLDLCMSNTGTGSGYGLRRFQEQLRRLARPLLMYNPIGNTQKNVAYHYDFGDEFYDLFLDDERQYSCSYFTSLEDHLKEAQMHKMRHIANKICLKPGHKLLDIGSGWGGLGLFMAHSVDVDVTGVTLSVEQQKYVEAQAVREGLADQVRFVPCDYRQEPDRIIGLSRSACLNMSALDITLNILPRLHSF